MKSEIILHYEDNKDKAFRSFSSPLKGGEKGGSIIKFIVSVVVAGMFLSGANAFVSVSPTVVELTMKSGDKASGTFVVVNTKSEKAEVTIEIKEWWNNQTRLPGLSPEEWLTIRSKNKFKLGAGKSRRIRYDVKTPAGFEGEAAAMIFFSIEGAQNAGGMNLQLRHGIPIYVIARGNDGMKASVKDCNVYFVQSSTSSMLEFSVDLENNGNVHIRPGGSISIYSGQKHIDTAALEWGWPVYPTRSHIYNARVPAESWAAGVYTANLEVENVTMNGEKTALGSKTIQFRIVEDGKIEKIN
ncbi:MAG: hypothetical protein A2219_08685 [Elusimicrobia bacterium RIFOXYA2_FULL_50_26]|nr:MAG: hypothetical protein A2219_08685 [Elusimicrobia bacterium RIFOXYA2_FULL_50_26]OGS25141.1 MAG: hypothetical protein A2314_02760 [Elusimicrobia bacterium RIFOXYB2_FULL_50_12]